MKKAIAHIRANVVAYLALFVALGGTGYAAVNLPRNSVGTAQLRNGAVTNSKLGKGSITVAKLNSRSIAGSVVFWAKIAQGGQVIASSEPASTMGWSSGLGSVFFRGQLSSKCFALGSPISASGEVAVQAGASVAGQEHLGVTMLPAAPNQPGPLDVNVAVICPV